MPTPRHHPRSPVARRAPALVDSGAWIAFARARDQHHAAARQWLARLGNQRITYTDAVSFAVMRSHRCAAAYTFDGDFVTAGFAVRP